jgi:hypothetical protein
MGTRLGVGGRSELVPRVLESSGPHVMDKKKRFRAERIVRPQTGQHARLLVPRAQAAQAEGVDGPWHAMQHSLGNRGVQRLLAGWHGSRGSPPAMHMAVQRALSAEERRQDLKADRFAGDLRLESAFDNSPAMRRGEHSEAVAKIQQALIDDGFPMPISTRKTGSPDGIFGRETRDTVKQFQTTHGLKVDGAVGRKTLGKLDELYAGPIAPKVPPKAKPEIEATEEAIGKHIVDNMDKANDPKRFSPSSGIWYSHNYEAMSKQDPLHYPWDPDYRNGYANPAYFLRIGWMDWLLRPGVSASAAIRAWLHGLTIAECNSTLVAIEIDALRAAMGDAKFDKEFGSADQPVAPQKRLRIKQGTKGTPVESYIKWTEAGLKGEAGTFGSRPAKVGGWYYFYNHPRYLLRHPDGAFQGENAIYVGRNQAKQQIWSGLGVSNVTEDGMLRDMAKAYNAGRSEGDYRWLVKNHVRDAPELRQPSPDYRALYVRYIQRIPDKFRHDKGEYPQKIDKQDILTAPEYELWGTKRKGGYVAESGKVLDAAKIKAHE